jgi:dipeptide/tripeptide permease
MIDWPAVAFNALWIVGCALVLAAFSHAHWLAQARNTRTRQLLNSPAFQLPFSIGLGLISCSLFLLSQSWIERVLWAILTIVFAWQETRRVLKDPGKK